MIVAFHCCFYPLVFILLKCKKLFIPLKNCEGPNHLVAVKVGWNQHTFDAWPTFYCADDNFFP